MASALIPTAERRSASRVRPSGATPVFTCRIRPGHQADVVDLSERGVLLETQRRLLPGRTIDLQWEVDGARDLTRAVVVRCEVASVLADRIVYRGAVQLERELSLASAVRRTWLRT